jgi:hypothetical protein
LSKKQPRKPSKKPKLERLSNGRPAKYSDPEIIDKLCKELSTGVPLSTACKLAGVGLRSVKRWKQEARCGNEAYKPFWHAIKKAMAKHEQELVNNIKTASLTQWQAAAWLLERCYPNKYGRRNNVSFNGDAVIKNGNISPEQFVKMLSADQLAQLISAVEAKTAELETAKDNHLSALTAGE